MWTKITSEIQLAALQEGSVLSKYPLEGDPVDSHDGANENNSGSRTVAANSMGQVRFVIDDMPQHIDLGA